MDLLIDILLDAGKDTLSLVPFLLVTYLALETLEHVAGDRVNGAIKRAGAAGPVVGSLLGMVPQCGFSAMAATLYAGRVVTLGTLVAVFLSTSDEMLPLLLAEQVPVQTMAMLLASKALIALVTGFIVDAAIRGLLRNARAHAAIRRTVLGTTVNPAHVNCAHDDHSGGDIIDEVAEAGVSADHIHELCERDHCGCDEDEDEHDHGHGHGHDHGHEGDHEHHHDHGHSHSHEDAPVLSIIRSAISHTVQVSVFIFLVTLILVAVLETFGESAIEQFLRGNETLAVLGSALVGLIPNCSASVVITQLRRPLNPRAPGKGAPNAGQLHLHRRRRRPRRSRQGFPAERFLSISGFPRHRTLPFKPSLAYQSTRRSSFTAICGTWKTRPCLSW